MPNPDMTRYRMGPDNAHARVVAELRELIDALDRRVPQVHRAGEEAIATAAATLRAAALKRIEELEGT